MFHTIRWRIAIPYLALVLLTTAGLVLHISDFVRGIYIDNLEAQLTSEALLIVDALSDSPAWDEPQIDLDPVARHYAGLLGARVSIVAPDGVVIGESHAVRAEMDNHLLRPEIQQALATGQGSSIRYSRTEGYEMMYVAVPVRANGTLRGFVRVALPLEQIKVSVARMQRMLWGAGLAVAAIAALLVIVIAERTARPVRQLTDVVQRMAEGDLHARLLPTSRDEVGVLTRTFNQMADKLQATIVTLSEERSRLSAVLENMADGALITDEEGRVRLINPAAARILGSDAEASLGRTFAEVVRDHHIIDLWRTCHEVGEEQSTAIEIGPQGRFLQVIVTPLRGKESPSHLVILQDLTRVRRLETVRRDFISNISHELRTPLASLKALVETLRNGAMDDAEAGPRFLDRMEMEVDALTQIVQELLELSRIESGQVPFDLKPAFVEEALIPAVERLRPQAERAGLELIVELEADLPPILADVERLQQVFTNLLHNAIKFTLPGGRVTVRTVHSDAAAPHVPISPCLLVSVSDTGVGIPADDLPRIFERFYKADRARSGGGTGLGLSIAKHIVLAHGGHIWAESVEGRGATFYVALPLATSASS